MRWRKFLQINLEDKFVHRKYNKIKTLAILFTKTVKEKGRFKILNK